MSTSPSGARQHDSRLVELMVAYQGGDLGAFENLYAILATELRDYFRRSTRDRCQVRDLTQDTFLEMHRARQSYLPALPVRPWVFGIARNVLARSRRAARYRVFEHAAPTLDDGNLLVTEALGGAALEIGEVEQALDELPAGMRDAWLLHHLGGLTFNSIARQLGISVMAAKLRSSRATRALRAALGGGWRRRK